MFYAVIWHLYSSPNTPPPSLFLSDTLTHRDISKSENGYSTVSSNVYFVTVTEKHKNSTAFIATIQKLYTVTNDK
jgi:hypothetical protein